MLYEIYKSKQLKFRSILASKLLCLKANIPYPFTSRVAYFSLFIECLFSSAVVA